jgi:hypothetical protein
MKYLIVWLMLKLWVLAQGLLIAAVLYFAGIELGADAVLSAAVGVVAALAILVLDPREHVNREFMKYPISRLRQLRQQPRYRRSAQTSRPAESELERAK